MASPRPSRPEADLETLKLLKSARMSAASIAPLLGRSLKWVEARLEELEAPSPQPETVAALSIPPSAPSGDAAKPAQREFTVRGDERSAEAGVSDPGHGREAGQPIDGDRCLYCDGSGEYNPDYGKPCDRCGGSGLEPKRGVVRAEGVKADPLALRPRPACGPDRPAASSERLDRATDAAHAPQARVRAPLLRRTVADRRDRMAVRPRSRSAREGALTLSTLPVQGDRS